MAQISDLLEESLKWMETFEKKIVIFDSMTDDEFYKGFKPYKQNLNLSDGLYVTIRCGLGGIYTTLNEIKDGRWAVEAADDSATIAYRKLTENEKKESIITVNGVNYCLCDLMATHNHDKMSLS